MQPVRELGNHPLKMLQLLVELLPQPGEFIGVAEVLGVHFLVELPRIGAIDSVAVRVRPFPPRLRTAGTVVALGNRGLFLGFRAVIVGRLAFHLLGLGAEHGILFRFRLAFTVLGVVLGARLLSAVVAVLGIVVRFGIDLGFRQV